VSPASSTLCAVVTYEPDLDRLSGALGAVQHEVDTIVFDNGSTNVGDIASLIARRFASVSLVRSPTNVGLATAYNQMSRHAREHSKHYLLLLDQDTICPTGYARALETYHAAPGNERCAAAGGQPIDRRAEQRRGAEVRRHRLVQSSGTSFRLAAFDDVGGFEDELFIHHVDKEWFHRAASRGWSTAVVPDLELDHQPGQDVVRFPLMPRAWRWQSDPRLYYLTRNTLRLCAREYLPTSWKVGQVGKTAVIDTGHLLFRGQRWERARMLAQAVRDAPDGR
jgi:rhamnosyltransferase